MVYNNGIFLHATCIQYIPVYTFSIITQTQEGYSYGDALYTIHCLTAICFHAIMGIHFEVNANASCNMTECKISIEKRVGILQCENTN